MTQEQVDQLPEPQRKALEDLRERAQMDREEFLQLVEPPVGRDSYVGVQLWGMYIGVEQDGYTHS